MTRSLAEGIETAEQLDLLHQYHCDYGQGYYFAKPMSSDAFFELIRTEHMHKGTGLLTGGKNL